VNKILQSDTDVNIVVQWADKLFKKIVSCWEKFSQLGFQIVYCITQWNKRYTVG